MAQIEKVLHNVSWETRGNQRYYYRGSRQQGRVVKEYVGRGAEAEAAAERDLAGRAERAARRQAEQQRRQEYESITEGAWGMATEVDATLARLWRRPVITGKAVAHGGGDVSHAKAKKRKAREPLSLPAPSRPSRLRLKNPCGATGSWIFANRSTASVRRPIAAIGGLRGRSRNVCRTLPASVLTLATWPVSPKGHSSKGFPAARPCLLRPLPNRRPRCDKSWPGLRQRCLRRWRCSGSWPLGWRSAGLRGAVSPGPDGRARGAILAARGSASRQTLSGSNQVTCLDSAVLARRSRPARHGESPNRARRNMVSGMPTPAHRCSDKTVMRTG